MNMDIELVKAKIGTNVYKIAAGRTVALHPHKDEDEVFYCVKGTGFGLLDGSEVVINVGDTFIARAGTLHGLRAEQDFYVVAIMIPVIN